ncbi:MAG TPA: hypothetical protein VG737_11810, partial [Cyclobacteriaceae bacterium]|nr:hypothetical protein [Cyclobacteriaceae bacterium]
MKTIIIKTLLLVCLFDGGMESDSDVNNKLSDYFFGLSGDSDITTLKNTLLANPDFVYYDDPNRDEMTSIVGTMKKDKHINPASVRNQVVIEIEPQGGKENVFFKLSVDFASEDLPLAMYEAEQLKADFKPLFTDATVKKEIGYHQEDIETLTLHKGAVVVN